MEHPGSDTASPSTAVALRYGAGDRVTCSNPTDPPLQRLAIKAVERLTGQPRLQRMYDHYLSTRREDDVFWRSAIEHLRLTVKHDSARLSAIPATGPLIVVANHPFGVLDGIAIGYLMSRVRTDFKLMAHAALTHLADGGCLIMFPAGRVSTAPKVLGAATDAPWKLFAGKLVAASRATVVPVYFEGQNGLLFHLASQFSETLREALILREVAKKIGADITARIGAPLSFEDLSDAPSRQALLDRLRGEVYGLRGVGA